MQITRRAFLRYAVAAGVGLGLGEDVLARVETVLAQTALPPVVWLSGSGCTGCSVSLLNAVNPTIDGLLTGTIALKYHSTLMVAAGDLAVAAATSTAQAGGHILVVEGAIPTAFGGRCCYVWDEGGVPVTMTEAVSSLAANASHLVAVGTCASYGGIPAAFAGAGAVGLGAFLGRPVVNLPGCPAHPDWIIGGLAALLAGTPPPLDARGRPTTYYPAEAIHERCPRREREEANSFGQAGLCLKELGCKGPSTHADCDIRRWNNGQNWCIGANGLCIGCSEPTFPRFPLHDGGNND
ncbi:MAG: hydrogenase small subunit [Anaerolineae bacterium]